MAPDLRQTPRQLHFYSQVIYALNRYGEQISEHTMVCAKSKTKKKAMLNINI